MRWLGIDPGLRITGFGCVDVCTRGSVATSPMSRQRDAVLIDGGVIRLDTERSVIDRLAQLHEELDAILAVLRPDAAAVEMLYAHYKHPATAIVMGHARGVIMLCLRQRHIPIVELRPTEIKKSLTSFGHAGKGQMQSAVQAEFALAEPPKPADAADAIAIALAGLRRRTDAVVRLTPE